MMNRHPAFTSTTVVDILYEIFKAMVMLMVRPGCTFVFLELGTSVLGSQNLIIRNGAFLQNEVVLVLAVIACFPWRGTALSEPLYGFLFLTPANLREQRKP